MMRGELISGDATATWSGVRLDSRGIRGGELFFALPGEVTDGHRFVDAAQQAGAAAAVVETLPAEVGAGALIKVDDSLEALHALTRAIRTGVPQHLVGVTGSSGKTTTKEMLAAMLEARYSTAASPGNLNNLYGFPVALLGIPEDTEWMVAEMGMSTPDELRQVSLLGRPDVAVFTNVRAAHLESFGTLEAIAEAKAELLAGLAPDGTVVANAADPLVCRIAARHPGRVVWYGTDESDVQVSSVRQQAGGGWSFLLHAGSESVEVDLPLFGRYNVENFLAAAACAHVLGVSLSEIAGSLERYRNPPHRGVVHALPEGVTMIDDTYNSNPDALTQALRSTRALHGDRHWAVVGEMLELGETAGQLHREVGSVAARVGFSPLVGVGELARELLEAAADEGAETHWFPDAASASSFVSSQTRPGDVVLVKGSRGVALETVVDALLAEEEN
jgi:UDP-N-acetylmuramoyl-tripeptide--D-alanyl-D-alanine ligase